MSFVSPPPTDISNAQAVNATIYARFLLACLRCSPPSGNGPKNARL
jgi:hypothetical protein